MVSVLDSGAEGPRFKSQSRCCRVTVLRKLFTPTVPLFTKQQLVAALLRVAGVTAGLAESNARFMTHVTCRLTAKNRDQLQNPTLGNRVWATFTFLTSFYNCCSTQSETVVWPSANSTDQTKTVTLQQVQSVLRWVTTCRHQLCM